MSVKWRKADRQAAKAWAIIPMPPIMGMINTTSPQSRPARSSGNSRSMITQKRSPYRLITDKQLAGLLAREDALFQKRTRKSKETFDKAQEMLLNGVPMPWMGDWGTSHPIFVSKASGNRVTDIDGNEYVDFCLGDTGAMFGHSPQATAEAVAKQVRQGITTMMPTEDALGIGEELGRRFGLPLWQVAMTATEANRYVIRICRTLTGRPKVLSMNECYHGSLDETLPHIGADGKLELRSDYDINPGLPKDLLSRVVEFNDVEALERELAHEDCACVLTEPVMTNCGMVLPMTQSGLQRMSRLPRWRNKWVGFYCAAIFRQTLIQSVEGRANLIQRNSDCCSGTLDDKCTGCTKSFFKFCVRERHRNRVSFCGYVGVPARSACLHTNGITLSPLQFPIWRFKREA